MKRFVAILLCLAMLLPILAGCNQGGTPTTGSAEKKLKVGYGRVDISPPKGTPLGGYGNPAERLSTSVTEPLYATCIAFTDENDSTVLLYHLDLTRSYTSAIPIIRNAIGKAVGLPTDRVMVSATHTHSGPDLEHTQSQAILDYTASLKQWMIEAAQLALADRKEAKMFTATTHIEKLNFIRHYLLDDGTYAGDKFGDFSGADILGHAGEADDLMQLVKFTREGSKDVILVNCQGHPHRDGGASKTNATADVIGALRSYMEEKLNCNFAYFSGASGNVNFSSRIPGEATSGYKEQGIAMGKYAVEAAKNFAQVKTGAVTILSQTYKGTPKTDTNWTIDVPMFGFSIGDVAFALAPYEMWCNNGTAIREASAFQMTFIVCYANMHLFYIPEAEAYDYGSYESGVSRFARGTAKLLEAEYIGLMKKLYETVNPGLTVPPYTPSAPGAEDPVSTGKYYRVADNGTAREATQSGYYRIRLMGNGQTKNYLVDGKDLVNQMDKLEYFTISCDSMGIVKSVTSLLDLGATERQEQVLITGVSDTGITAKSADGKELTLRTTANTEVFDLRQGQASYESATSLKVNDTVTVLSGKSGEVFFALVHDRIVVKSYCPHCKEDVEWGDWTSSDKLPVGSSGHFKLCKDVTLTGQQNMTANSTLILDLNGHTVYGAKNKRILALYAAGTYLAILDSSPDESGKMIAEGTDMEEGACVWLRYGTFELFSGTLDGSKVTVGRNGGVVQAGTSSEVFIMHGGTITGGTSVSRTSEGGNGGNVSISTKMIMYGGLITGGKAVAYKEGDTVIRGGLGGNVYIANEGKVFEMYGGTITNGQAEVKENNVYIGTNSVFKQEGGTVG